MEAKTNGCKLDGKGGIIYLTIISPTNYLLTTKEKVNSVVVKSGRPLLIK